MNKIIINIFKAIFLVNRKIITFMLSGEFTVALRLYVNLNLGGYYYKNYENKTSQVYYYYTEVTASLFNFIISP